MTRFEAHSPDSPSSAGVGLPTTPIDYLNELFDRSIARSDSRASVPAADVAVTHGPDERLIQLILRAARQGPCALRRPWGHVVVEVFAPSGAGLGAIALRFLPSSLWGPAEANPAPAGLSHEDCTRWLRPTAWALARRFLPRGVLLANLSIARWQPRHGELFALAVLDGPLAAEVCIDLELSFIDEHMPTILASLKKEMRHLRRATRHEPVVAEAT